MSMGTPKKIYAKDNPELALTVTKGHFSSDRFHVNYYIDMTTLKMRKNDAQAVAKAMVSRYINRVNLAPSAHFTFESELIAEFSESMATKAPIDTIICMDGCEVIGAYVANKLANVGITTLRNKGNRVCKLDYPCFFSYWNIS